MKELSELLHIIADLSDPKDIEKLLGDLLTDSERDALSLRWRVLKDLHAGMSQRAIAEKRHMSLCKITRGSKILKKKNSLTKKLLDDLS